MLRFPRNVTVAANKFDFFYWSDGDVKPNGHEGKFLDLLSEVLRFEYRLVSPVDKLWGSISEDGNWTGMIGMISRGEVDMAVGHISVTEERKLGADFSEPYTDNKLSFATDLPSMKPKAYTYLYPFELHTWACFLSVLLIMPFVLGSLYKAKLSYTKLLFIVFGTVLRQDFFRDRTKRNFWIGCWWFVASVFSIYYAAVISSFLTVPLYQTPLRKYEELARAVARGQYAVYYRKGTASMRHLYESGQEHLVRIAEAIQKNKWVANEFLDPGEKFGRVAFLAPRLRLHFQYGKPPFGKKYVSDDDSVFRDVSIAVRKDFCCKHALDRAIYRIKCAGLFDKLIADELYRRWIRSSDNQIPYTSNFPSLSIISPSDISGALFALFCGYCLSGVGFLYEIASAHINSKCCV